MPNKEPIKNLLVVGAGDGDAPAIQEFIKTSERERGDRWTLIEQPAESLGQLRRLLDEFEPAIMHLKGDGSSQPSFFLHDDGGTRSRVSEEELSQTLYDKPDLIVVVDGCGDRAQVDAISRVTEGVVWIDSEIVDEAREQFAGEFYRNLGSGSTVPMAFESGIRMLQMRRGLDTRRPELFMLSIGDDWRRMWIGEHNPVEGQDSDRFWAEKLIAEAARTHAKTLSLRRLQLTSLPGQLAELPQLEELDLSQNKLEELDGKLLLQLPRLRVLRVDDCGLRALPAELSSLNQLVELTARRNDIGDPDVRLPTMWLERLDLANNLFAEFPANVLLCGGLKMLGLGSNQLRAMPSMISELAQLEELYLDHNQLRILPDVITSMKLRILGLGSNQIEQLPATIGALFLEELYIDQNRLRHLPEEIGRATQLRRLGIGGNRIVALPEAIGQLSQLEVIYADNNQLHSLPEVIGQLTKLRTLELSVNQLGSIPRSLGQLVNLKKLALGTNDLQELPVELGQLSQLEELLVDNNPLRFPPQDVVSQGRDAILEFLRNAKSSESTHKDTLTTSTGSPEAFLGNALIIGVNKYARGHLEGSVRSAKQFAQVLIKDGGYQAKNVRLLLDEGASRQWILNELNRLAEISHPDHLSLVFFSGMSRGFQQDLDLIAGGRPNELLSAREVVDTLRSAAGNALIILDCSNAGILQAIPGVAVLAACRDEPNIEVRHDGTVQTAFAHNLIEGLRRGAASEDGRVWLLDLYEYILPRVASQMPQRPILIQESQDNFPIALFGGGKGLNLLEDEEGFRFDVFVACDEDETSPLVGRVFDDSLIGDHRIAVCAGNTFDADSMSSEEGSRSIKDIDKSSTAEPALHFVTDIERGLRYSARTLVVPSESTFALLVNVLPNFRSLEPIACLVFTNEQHSFWEDRPPPLEDAELLDVRAPRDARKQIRSWLAREPLEEESIPLHVWFYIGSADDDEYLDVPESIASIQWGANKRTVKDDIVLMYLPKPHSHIRCLFRALNDASKPESSSQRWDHVIDLGQRLDLPQPVKLVEFKTHPQLAEWSLARMPINAMKRKIDLKEEGYWEPLRALLVARNPEIAERLASWEETSTEDLFSDAVEVAREIRDSDQRAETLRGMRQFVSKPLRSEIAGILKSDDVKQSEIKEGYQHDIYVSSLRSANYVTFAREIVAELKQLLIDRFPTLPRVFFDEQEVDLPTRWPDSIDGPVSASRCLLAIRDSGYYTHAQCLTEWHSFAAREVECESNLIFPIDLSIQAKNLSNPEHSRSIDLSRVRDGIFNKESAAALEVRTALVEAADTLEHLVRQAPKYSPSFPAVFALPENISQRTSLTLSAVMEQAEKLRVEYNAYSISTDAFLMAMDAREVAGLKSLIDFAAAIQANTAESFQQQVRKELAARISEHTEPPRIGLQDSGPILVSRFMAQSIAAAVRLTDSTLRTEHVLDGMLSLEDCPTSQWLAELLQVDRARLHELVREQAVSDEPRWDAIAEQLRRERLVEGDAGEAGMRSFDIWLSTPREEVGLGQEFPVTVTLGPIGSGGPKAELIDVSNEAIEGGNVEVCFEIGDFAAASGDNFASLPLPNAEDIQSVAQSTRFHLTALRPGACLVIVEVFASGARQTSLEAEVTVADLGQPRERSTRAVELRPVAQPDVILHVDTLWSADRSSFRYRYALTCNVAAKLFDEPTSDESESIDASWRTQTDALLNETFQPSGRGIAVDQQRRLRSLGNYLYDAVVPKQLANDLKLLSDVRRTLLIEADRDAWLPWELFHDGKTFLSDRFLISRWPAELSDARPFEIPLGHTSVAYYSDIEQPQQWSALLDQSEGVAPPPQVLPGGVVDLRTVDRIRGLHLMRKGSDSSAAARVDAPILPLESSSNGFDNSDDKHRVDANSKLNLRRNRPLVTLSYLDAGCGEWTAFGQTWVPAFMHAGCSALIGPHWAVDHDVEATFVSVLYRRLWRGDDLGTAFERAKRMARQSAPDSLSWMAYVLVGDPRARPYRPTKGDGYAVVEPVGREMETPVSPGDSARFRVKLQRQPPVWHRDRLVEVVAELNYEKLQVHVATLGLEVDESTIDMRKTPVGDYLGWFTLLVPADAQERKMLVQLYYVDGPLPIHNILFELPIAAGELQ